MKRFKISLALLAIIFAIATAFTSAPNAKFSLSGEANTTAAEPPIYDLDISDDLNNTEGNTDEEKVSNYADICCVAPWTPVCFKYKINGGPLVIVYGTKVPC